MRLYLGQSVWCYFSQNVQKQRVWLCGEGWEHAAVVGAENVWIAVAKKLLRCWVSDSNNYTTGM